MRVNVRHAHVAVLVLLASGCDGSHVGQVEDVAADTAVTDTSAADTSVADTSVADTSVADTSVADSTITDTAITDAAITDSADLEDTTADTAPPTDTAEPPDVPACDQAACAAAAAPCMRGVCTPLGCKQVPDDGASCDDGRDCTLDDRCQDGLCAGLAKRCDDGIACTRDRCDEALGCVADSAGCPCDVNDDCQDETRCDGIETCVDHRCVEGTPVACAPPADPCLAARCDAATGACEEVARVGEITCDDGHFCTTDDHCEGGACVGHARVCSDDLACTVSACDDDSAACVVDASACACLVDADCQDDSLCNGVERCVANACVAGEPVLCRPSADPCLVAACAPATGVCGLAPAAGAPACDDGQVCTTGDHCTAGACGGSARVCDDGLACSSDSCSEAAGGCVADRSACACLTDAQCDDGNACNGRETCVANACVPGTAVTCAASADPCLTARCLPDSGACALVPAAGAPSCDDGLFCTTGDRCQAGLCVGAPRACGDALGCSIDGCDESADACTHATSPCECLSDADCARGDLCDGVERCVANRCVAGTPVVCGETADVCTTRRCNGATGGCDVVPVTGFVACDDGKACTVGDHCVAGACQGDARSCSDDLACSSDTCSEAAGGCAFDTSACACLSDGDCADGNLCNGVERCVQNHCVPGATIVCAPSPNPCVATGCVAATGACVVADRPDTTACDDGDPCSDDDHCAGGACAGSAVACDDGNPCTNDTCVAFLGCRALALDGPTCDLPHADAACDHGVCTLGGCAPGFGDCTAAPGCETALAAGCDCGDVPATWYHDGDHDGRGNDAEALVACLPPADYVLLGGDCADGDPGITPGRAETCDGVDEDCDQATDEGLPCVDAAPYLAFPAVHGGAEWLAEFADGSILAGGVRIDRTTGAVLATGFGPFIPSVYAPVGAAPASAAAVVSAWANATAFDLDGAPVFLMDTGGCCNYAAAHFAVAQDEGVATFLGANEYDLTDGARFDPAGGYPKFAALWGDRAVLYGDGGRLVMKPQHVPGPADYDVTVGATQLAHVAITADGTVVTSTGGNKPYGDWALSLTPGGHLVAVARMGGQVLFDVVANSVTAPVLAGDGTIVVGTQAPPLDQSAHRGGLAAYSAAGALRWTYDLGAFPDDVFIGDDGRAWVLTARGQIVAVDLATGAPAIMFRGLQGAREMIATHGAIVTGHGQVLSNTADASLPFITSGYDPASPWPVQRADNQRSSQGRVYAWSDGDGDGYGAGAPVLARRVGPGQAGNGGDCNDGNAAVHPGAVEQCNGVDDDCNNTPDDVAGPALCATADDLLAWRTNIGVSGWLAQFADGDLFVGGYVVDRDDGAVVNAVAGFAIPSILSPPWGPELISTAWQGTQVYLKDGTLYKDLATEGCCNYPAVYMAMDRVAGIGSWGGWGRFDLRTGVRLSGGAPGMNWNAFYGHDSLYGWGRGSVYGTGGVVERWDFASGSKWKVERPETPQVSQIAIDFDGNVVTSTGGNQGYGDWALVPSSGGHLLRFTRAGVLAFDVAADSVGAPVLQSDGTILIGTQAPPYDASAARGGVSAYSQTGNKRWSRELGSLPSDLFVGDDHRIYVLTRDGRLIALNDQNGAIDLTVRGLRGAREMVLSAPGRIATSAAESIDLPPGFAQGYEPSSPWPIQRHDNQRTNAQIDDAGCAPFSNGCSCTAQSALMLRLAFDGDFSDTSGQGHDSIPSGGYSLVASPRGQALALTGSGWLDLNGSQVLGPTTSRARTVSLWFDPGASGGGILIDQYRNYDPNNCSFFVAYDRTSGVVRASGEGVDVVDGTPGQLTGWHHVAVTFAPSGATAVYFDGALAGSGTLTLPPSESPYGTVVGALPGIDGSYFTGSLDEVRVYGRVLSADEIAAIASESGCGAAP